MSTMHLVTDISQIKLHYKENHVVKVRVFGVVLEYNAMEGTITVQSLNIFSRDPNGVIKLTLDEDRSISNPEIAYMGTLVDIYGLYNGKNIMLIDVRFPNSDTITEKENIDILQKMSQV